MRRQSNGPFTGGERRVLAAIRAHWAEHGYAPTLTEIQQRICTRSRSHVVEILDELRCRGLVQWRPGCARTLRVIHERTDPWK